MSEKWSDSFDILGIQPRLYTYSNKRFSTKFGIIMSLLTITSALALSLYFVSDFFQRTKFTLIFNQSTDFQRVLNLSDFPTMFRLRNVNAPLNFSISYPIIAHYTYKPNSLTPTIQVLKYEKCDIDKHFGKYRGLFLNITNLETYNCISPEKNNLTLSGRYGDKANGYSYLVNYLATCVNNSATNPGVICSNQSVIDSTLSYLPTFYSTVILDAQLDHNSVDQPIKLAIRGDENFFTPLAMYKYDFYIKKVLYKQDVGFVFEDVNDIYAFNTTLMLVQVQ
jgi:hypothetical protein